MKPPASSETSAFPFLAFCVAVLLASAAAMCMAADTGTLLAYPAKGQDAKQQDKDRYECFDWSRSQSGYDPTRAAPATVTPNAAADRDVGKGAATGVLGSSLVGRMKQQQPHQQRQQLSAAGAQQKSTYDRAFSACMEARGYVVR